VLEADDYVSRKEGARERPGGKGEEGGMNRERQNRLQRRPALGERERGVMSVIDAGYRCRKEALIR